MILPDTPFVELPDEEGVIITKTWGAGDREAEKL